MGNSQSNDVSESPTARTSSSAAARVSWAERKGSTASTSTVGSVRGTAAAAASQGKRYSLSHESSGKARGKAAPLAPSSHNPTTTLISSSGTTSTPTTTTATVSASPQRIHGHTRARSITHSSSATTTPTSQPQLAALEAAYIAHAHFANNSPTDYTTANMGQADSRPVGQRPVSRPSTLPIHSSTPPQHRPAATPIESESDSSHQQERQPDQPPESIAKPAPITPISHPVDVPPAHSSTDGPADKDDYIPIGTIESSSYSIPAANYSRPPRLPLPIEEEVHTPGSPLITPQDVAAGVKDVETSALDQADVEGGALPRKTSVLSSTTIDEDEVGDDEAFANEAQWGEIRVPTTLEWHGGGDKIFVTGTFCNWEKKVKLHRNKDKSGFSATVNLRPGTHHVKFLVDGEMVTSNDLPTTVDFTNILVNYIEIVAPLPQDKKQAPVRATPMPIPGAALTAGQATGTAEPAARPLSPGAKARAPETEADVPVSPHEAVGPKGEHLDPLSEQTPTPEPSAPPATASEQPRSQPKPTPAPKQKLPRPKYTNQIPEFLIDLDNYNNPEDEKFQRAQKMAAELPHPPSLPMFLSKSILNGATPHKDDASVLVMPNHTVLNHLATSSIKGGVLATSGTTRYKRKFLTTIMYKPTSDDG